MLNASNAKGIDGFSLIFDASHTSFVAACTTIAKILFC